MRIQVLLTVPGLSTSDHLAQVTRTSLLKRQRASHRHTTFDLLCIALVQRNLLLGWTLTKDGGFAEARWYDFGRPDYNVNKLIWCVRSLFMFILTAFYCRNVEVIFFMDCIYEKMLSNGSAEKLIKEIPENIELPHLNYLS